MTSSQPYNNLIQRWTQIPTTYAEANLEANLVNFIWQALGLNPHQIKANPGLGTGTGLKPDFLIYQNPSQPPVLVVEDKKREPQFAIAPEQGFADWCKQQPRYKEAVGYPVPSTSNNGIRQYLDKNKVSPNCLASYGLVFNGDFFQLWRRVDGLVFPLTRIQKVTQTNLPQLMQQLEYCLRNPQPALVTAVWNQKGGVAKTTNTLNLGAVLAIEGKKVLLIDLDRQTDLTMGVGLNPSQHSGYLQQCAAQLDLKNFAQARNILDAAIQTRKFPTTDKQTFSLDILPGESDSIRDFRDSSYKSLTVLFKRLISLLQDEYDYIFIDVSPNWDRLTQCIFNSCNTVLIPVDYGRKSLHHAVNLYKSIIPQVREKRATRDQLHIGPWNLGLVFSNCPPDRGKTLDECIQGELTKRSFTGKQCITHLRSYAQTKVAEFKHVPVISWRNSPITQLYTKLANEVFLNHNFADD
jgi:cellulose biosynthesis protein BcsQ